MAVGYGHAWIYERYFLVVQTGVGPGGQFQKIEDEQGENDKTLNIALKFNLNFAFGRNSSSSNYGARFLMDSLASNVAGLHVYSTLISVQAFYGFRF
jgi:hypothetical protein